MSGDDTELDDDDAGGPKAQSARVTRRGKRETTPVSETKPFDWKRELVTYAKREGICYVMLVIVVLHLLGILPAVQEEIGSHLGVPHATGTP